MRVKKTSLSIESIIFVSMGTTTLYDIYDFREERETCIYEVRLNPDHEIFKGHFPGMPIMPGVCMLQLLKDCVTKTTGKNFRFDYMKSCKFVSVVDPKQNPLLTITFTLAENNLQATLLQNETPVMKLKTTLTGE